MFNFLTKVILLIKDKYYLYLSYFFNKRIIKIYLIRHGEIYNPNNIIYGRLPDYPLSFIGINQCKSLTYNLDNLFKKNDKISIISSPLKRTQQTGTIIHNLLKCKYIIETSLNENLIEINNPYEGELISVVAKKNWNIFDFDNQNQKYETYNDVCSRAINTIYSIVRNTKSNNNIVITHGEIILCLRALALKKQLSLETRQELQHDGFFPKTASITTLYFNRDCKLLYSKFY